MFCPRDTYRYGFFVSDKHTDRLCLQSSSERRLTCCWCVSTHQQHIWWKLKTFLKCRFVCLKKEWITICSNYIYICKKNRRHLVMDEMNCMQNTRTVVQLSNTPMIKTHRWHIHYLAHCACTARLDLNTSLLTRSKVHLYDTLLGGRHSPVCMVNWKGFEF